MQGRSVATWGGLACLVASASYGVSYVYQHRFLTPRGHSPLALSAGQLLAATGLMSLTLPFGGLQSVHLRGDAVAALIVLGVLGTGAGYVLNFRLIRDEGPAASIVTYLIPVVAVTFGAFGLSEALTARVLIGVVVVLVGVAIAQRHPTHPKADTDSQRGPVRGDPGRVEGPPTGDGGSDRWRWFITLILG